MSAPESATALSGGFRARQIWSLLDMLEILSTSVLKLGSVAGVVEAMLNPRIPKLDPRGITFPIPKDAKDVTIPYLQALRDLVRPLEAKTAVVEIDRLLSLVESETCSVEVLQQKHASIFSRIEDHLEGTKFLYIELKKADLYKQPTPLFGDNVANAFPSAAEDIAEAGKCVALDRSTAAVFHLMRALECAVQVVAEKLDAAIHDEHGRCLPWGVIASNMKSKIDKMPIGDETKIQWYRAQQNMEAVNRAWRAPTAHPKQTYTEAEAENVLNASKSFMNELAKLVLMERQS